MVTKPNDKTVTRSASVTSTSVSAQLFYTLRPGGGILVFDDGPIPCGGGVLGLDVATELPQACHAIYQAHVEVLANEPCQLVVFGVRVYVVASGW